MEPVEPHEQLRAWQQAHRLALEVYRVSERWPRSERYELTSQARRAALSIPTNIAEGVGTYGPREFRRYFNLARASLAELAYLLRFARDRRVLTQEEWAALNALKHEVGRLTWGGLRSMGENRGP